MKKLERALYHPLVACLALSTGLLGACSQLSRVETDYQPSYNFSQVKTIAWFITPDPTAVKELQSARIEAALIRALAAKDLVLVDDKAKANLTLAYQFSIEQRVDVDTVVSGWGYQPWFDWPMAVSHQEVVARQYKAGTLTIDLIDPTSNKLVWRGSVESRYRSLPPQERDAEMERMVNEILSQYPPQEPRN